MKGIGVERYDFHRENEDASMNFEGKEEFACSSKDMQQTSTKV